MTASKQLCKREVNKSHVNRFGLTHEEIILCPQLPRRHMVIGKLIWLS